MDLQKIFEEGQGDANNTEVVAFRLDTKTKAELLDLCKERNLSLGRLMRALIQELLAEAK